MFVYKTITLLIVDIFCTSINMYIAIVSNWSFSCCSFSRDSNTVTMYIFTRTGRYTLSVKLSDFIVWRRTWRKDRVNCAVLTGNSAGLRTVLSSRLSHTHNCAVHSRNPTVSSVYLPTPRWHHLKAHPFLAIHSADEHRTIYSFSNTTSYFTFYAFFSSFRIT